MLPECPWSRVQDQLKSPNVQCNIKKFAPIAQTQLQTLRDAAVPERALQLALDVGGVVVGRVACWGAWIAGCLVQLAARLHKP